MPKCQIPMQGCESTQLKEFGYDPVTSTLAVRFNSSPGVVYTYANVPAEVADGMRAADQDPESSVGKFFNTNIRSKGATYPVAKIDEREEESQHDA